MSGDPGLKGGVPLSEIFRAFLVIGATSFGGGVMAYLRHALIDKRRWVDDETFVQMLAMSQSLPGLNSTNIAVLVGDRLRGTAGAAAAMGGICLPGGLIMFVIGMLHSQHAERPFAAAMLHGVAAAAVGLVMAVAVQLGRKATVSVYKWLNSTQLIHLYSLGQVAPGPNMMMVAAIGERVAGMVGAVAVVVAFFGPTGLLTLWTGRLWRRLEGWRWRESIQRGLAPVSVGLLLAGSISVAKGALTGWTGVGVAAAVFAVLMSARINPAFLVLCGALPGLFVFGGR